MRIVSVLLLIGFACLLSACGRMNAPVPPEGSVYKRVYY